jgi:hypothetical protein
MCAALLVMVQVALSVVALTGAGLFLRSLRNAQAVDPGFDAAHMATLALDSEVARFHGGGGREFYTRVLERAGSLPGAAAATLAFNPPFTVYRARSISMEGTRDRGRTRGGGAYRSGRAGIFSGAAYPAAARPRFLERRRGGAPRVAVVNETMARHFWSGSRSHWRAFALLRRKRARGDRGSGERQHLHQPGRCRPA